MSKKRAFQKKQKQHDKVMTIEITQHSKTVSNLTHALMQIAQAVQDTTFTDYVKIEILSDGTTRIRVDDKAKTDD